MQDVDETIPAPESPDTEGEESTEEEVEVRIPRKVEPEPDTPKEEEGEDKGQEDTEKALRSEVAKLKEQLAEVSDQVTKAQEPKDDTPPPTEDDLLKGLTVSDDWKPPKETYSSLMNEQLKRQVELTRRVIADEVNKAQQQTDEENKEGAKIRASFQHAIDRLRGEGKIPLVTNPENPNDPGLKAEEAMIKLASRYNTIDVDMLYNDIYSKQIQRRTPTNPISRPTKGQPDISKAINYEKDVKGKSLMDILESEQEE